MMQCPLVAFSATSPPGRNQGLALARYVEAQLLSAGVGWSSVEIRESPQMLLSPKKLLAATAARGALPCPVVSLDIGAAVAMAYARQYPLLRDTATVLEAALFLPDEPDLVLADRKSTRLNSSHANISYAVFCLKK